MNYMSSLVANGGTLLFVGTKRAAQAAVREQAERCGMPYVNHRWLGGMLTNYKTVNQSINRLKSLEAMAEDGSLDRLSKKEALMLRREQEKLDRSLGGIKNMGGIPDALFIIDVGYEKIAVSEAIKLGIPVIGIVDTNNSIEGVDYVIPGNDDAIRAIKLYVEAAADAVETGKLSVANITADEEDEFVELEAGGDVLKKAKKTAGRKKTARKVTVRKKTATKAAKKDAPADTAEPEQASAEPAAAEADAPADTAEPEQASAEPAAAEANAPAEGADKS
jgi:small subunit ribosomal protein S2